MLDRPEKGDGVLELMERCPPGPLEVGAKHRPTVHSGLVDPTWKVRHGPAPVQVTASSPLFFSEDAFNLKLLESLLSATHSFPTQREAQDEIQESARPRQKSARPRQKSLRPAQLALDLRWLFVL